MLEIKLSEEQTTVVVLALKLRRRNVTLSSLANLLWNPFLDNVKYQREVELIESTLNSIKEQTRNKPVEM